MGGNCNIQSTLELGGTLIPPAMAIWVSQNVTVEFNFWKKIMTSDRERVPLFQEFSTADTPENDYEKLSESLLRSACHDDNLLLGPGWLCVDLIEFEPTLTVADMWYPFEIKLTTPRPTESTIGRNVRIKFMVFTDRDLDGNVDPNHGFWRPIPYNCFQSPVHIRDSPFQGLLSIPGAASESQSFAVPTGPTATSPDPMVPGARWNMEVSNQATSRVQIQLRDNYGNPIRDPNMQSNLILRIRRITGPEEQMYDDYVVTWRDDLQYYEGKFYTDVKGDYDRVIDGPKAGTYKRYLDVLLKTPAFMSGTPIYRSPLLLYVRMKSSDPRFSAFLPGYWDTNVPVRLNVPMAFRVQSADVEGNPRIEGGDY